MANVSYLKGAELFSCSTHSVMKEGGYTKIILHPLISYYTYFNGAKLISTLITIYCLATYRTFVSLKNSLDIYQPKSRDAIAVKKTNYEF